jgi:molybdopterin-guanine dinucleotide biosynthesis protein A
MFESFILAGGKSSRMKRNKALLKLERKTLVEHSIAALQDINSPQISIVVAESSSQFEGLPKNIKIISDICKNRGTLGGIHSALAHCQEKYTLIFACDYPFVSGKLLNYLLEAGANNRFDCVTPVQKDGIPQPLCTLYKTKKCLRALTAILEESGKTPSARNFLKQINTKFIEFEEYAALPNSDYFFMNVNTPQDFERALEIKHLLDEK